MIIVSRSWSGVMNGELYVWIKMLRWVCVGVWLAGYRQ